MQTQPSNSQPQLLRSDVSSSSDLGATFARGILGLMQSEGGHKLQSSDVGAIAAQGILRGTHSSPARGSMGSIQPKSHKLQRTDVGATAAQGILRGNHTPDQWIMGLLQPKGPPQQPKGTDCAAYVIMLIHAHLFTELS